MPKTHSQDFGIVLKTGLAANINTTAHKNSSSQGEIAYTTDGKNIYVFDGTQYLPVDGTQDVATSTTTVTNTVTETTVYTGTIPANSLFAGEVIKVFTSGVLTNATASDDITINIYIGSTLIETYNPAIGNVTGADWHTNTQLAVRSLGASGSIAVHGEVHLDGNTSYDNSIETIDTTVAEDITVKVQWDNAKAGNTLSLYQGHLEFKMGT